MRSMAVWIVLGIYILLMALVAIFTAKKADSLTNFVVGGRNAGPWMSAFAYGTTYFSAVLFIGYAGRSGWDYGLWAVLIGVGNALLGTYLAWKLLADRTREVTRRLKIKTMPQMFEKRYQSKPMKIFAAIVIFIFMTPYSASVYSGLSYLCESVLGIDYQLAMLFIAAISAGYLVLGGYVASLFADFIQGIIMIFGILAMIFCIVRTDQVGGFVQGMHNLTEKMGESGIAALTPEMVVGLISLILLTSVGTWGMPQMVHKFYGVADRKGIKRGTIISTVFCAIISCGAYFVGSLSRLFFEQVPTVDGKPVHDLLIPQILSHLPTILLGVILVLVLSASVSTLSGITLTSCSAISMDLIAGGIKPDMTKKQTFTLTRVLCVLFIIASYLIASIKSPILMLMSFSWGSIAGAFLAPYLLGLYWKRLGRKGAWAGMVGGLSTSLILAVASGFDTANAPLFGILSMAVSFLLCIVVTLVTKREPGGGEFFARDAQDAQ